MTLAGLCLVVLGFLRTKKDSHGKATNTEEQKEKKRKKEQKAVTVTEGIWETKKKIYITVALVSLDIFVLLLMWKDSFLFRKYYGACHSLKLCCRITANELLSLHKKVCGQWSGTKVWGYDEYHNKYDIKNPPFHIGEMLFARSLINSILTKCLISSLKIYSYY